MRRYLIFVTTALSLLMSSIDTTIIAVAFPSLIKGFNTSVLWAGWSISIYYIAITVAMPLMGKVSDTFGRKRVFLASLMLFTGSSLACGLAPTIHTLILFRFFQGIGGAAFLPTASGIVADHFPKSRERAIGLFSSIFPVGGIIGPNLGGWIISRFSWRHIFYINLPIGLVLLVLSLLLLKDSKVHFRARMDLTGAQYMAGGVIFLMFGLNLMSENLSARSVLFSAICLLLGLFLLNLFFQHEKRESDPLFDTSLLRSRPFLAANLLNMIVGAGVFGVFAFVPLYATSVHKLSTLMSGVILTPRSFGAIPAAAMTSVFLRRWGYRRPIVLGLSVVAAATILLGAGVYLDGSVGGNIGITEILSFLVLLTGIGMGLLFPAVNNACIELMPEKVATIVGLRGMFRSVGGALGISLITLILHLNSNAANGFTIAFVFFGIALLSALPLAFLVPEGGKTRPL